MMQNTTTNIQLHKHSFIKKMTLLVFCLLFDLIGMLSYLLPGIGEVVDVFWAPFSAILIYLMFRKYNGAIGGVLGFMEEIMPGADIIPTFTLMWFYKYYFSKEG